LNTAIEGALTVPGTVGPGHILGRYELLIPVAAGGMAMVWAARLKGTRGFQKIVAVKTMLPRLSEDNQFEQMFLDEASLASQIRHPHVVEILDLGEQDGVLFLVMEWIDGVPLNQIMKAAKASGGVPLPIAVRIVMQSCAGLHAAHELRDGKGQLVGLVHRDVSPQNLIVTYDGVTKVVDFGVAKATAVGGGATGAGQIKGKVGYMAPEQIEGESIDRRVDIFAMGIVLYALTTGKHPFRRESDAATMYNICSPQAALAPRKFIPDYPEALENVLMKSLAKSAADRYTSANDMLRDLDHALPSSERANTDQDVAEFIRRLVGERLEERRNTLSEALLRADQSAIQRIPDVPNPGSISVVSGEASALTRPATHPYLARRRLYFALGGLLLVGAAGAGLALVSGDPPPPVSAQPAAKPAPQAVVPEPAAPTATTVETASSEPAVVAEPPPPSTRQVLRPYQPSRPSSRSATPPPKKPPPTSWKHDPGF
jgi:eukaryotic-like serine/threonine-protein kinase